LKLDLLQGNVYLEVAMIKVIVLHQTKLIANIIASVLDDEPDIYVVGKTTTVEDTLDKIKLSDCNMVLVSISLPNGGALALTRALSADQAKVKVLILGMPKSNSVIMEYVMAGASGYVLQDVPVSRLFEIIRATQDDKALVSPSVAAALIKNISELAAVASNFEIDLQKFSNLTPREGEVLGLLAEDLSNHEIASRLTIEVGTVKNHVHNILNKLEVSNRKEAALYFAAGLLE
jgi:two-component system, NarL family, nitrate/nitrite response regulator NarL